MFWGQDRGKFCCLEPGSYRDYLFFLRKLDSKKWNTDTVTEIRNVKYKKFLNKLLMVESYVVILSLKTNKLRLLTISIINIQV